MLNCDANVTWPVCLSFEKDLSVDELVGMISDIAEVGKVGIECEVLAGIVSFDSTEELGVPISVVKNSDNVV